MRRGSKLLSRYLQYSVKRMRPVVDRIEADRKEAKDTIKQLSQVSYLNWKSEERSHISSGGVSNQHLASVLFQKSKCIWYDIYGKQVFVDM